MTVGAKWLVFISVIALTCTSTATGQNAGFYSRNATPIWDRIAGGKKPLFIRAPDRLSVVRAEYFEQGNDEHVSLVVSGAIGTKTINIGPGIGSELLWAEDSHGFFVTTSDEGANGAYRLLVIGRFGGVLQMKELTNVVAVAFGHPVRCGSPESPNVAGVAWLPSGDLLAVAEIIDHSNCDSFGTFRMYKVDPRVMRIIRTFNQLQAKAQFRRLLGQELINAPNECIRNPKSCFVNTNHPELYATQKK